MFESSCIRLHAGRQLHAVLKGTSIQVTLVYYHGLLAFVWTCLCRDSFVASEYLLAGTVAPGTLVQRRQLGIVLVDAYQDYVSSETLNDSSLSISLVPVVWVSDQNFMN